jgi:hypothetical protein
VSTSARIAVALGPLLGVLLLAGCGGSGDGTAEAAVDTPACQASLTPTAVPKDGSFPEDWPFPDGTFVTGTEQVPGGGLAVTAQVGAEFDQVLPFMQHDLEDAGFVATKGEAERDDAEATWAGHGWSGTWAIKESETCKGTTLLQVAAVEQ